MYVLYPALLAQLAEHQTITRQASLAQLAERRTVVLSGAPLTKTLPSSQLSADIGLHTVGELSSLCVEKHLNNHTFVNHMSYSLLSLETQKTRATFLTSSTHTQNRNFLTNLDRFSPEGSGFVKRSAQLS